MKTLTDLIWQDEIDNQNLDPNIIDDPVIVVCCDGGNGGGIGAGNGGTVNPYPPARRSFCN